MSNEFLYLSSVRSPGLYQVLVTRDILFSMKQKMNVAKQAYNLEKENFSNSNLQRAVVSIAKRSTTEGVLQSQCSKVLPPWQDVLQSEVHNDCLSCGTQIVHPLCPNCIAKAFNQWTKKFPEHHELKGKLNVFMKHHNHNNGESKRCVHCGKNVHICPYCFTSHLHDLVKETGLGVRALSEFLFIFNFDFEHNGYSQELEAYGGY